MENSTIKTITIIITGLLIVYFGTRFKKKKEAEMRAEYDAMVERGDLVGLSSFYKKQLYWWVPLTALFLIVLIGQIIEGRPINRLLIPTLMLVIFAYRVYTLCKNRIEVERMKKQHQEQMDDDSDIENPEAHLQKLRDLLGDECEITPLEGCSSVEEITQTYLSAKAEGEQAGFYPVILQLDDNLLENIEDELCEEASVETLSGEMVIEKRLEDLKECFDDETEWNELIGGETETEGCTMDTMEGADTDCGQFVLVKISVKKASEIFAKIPMGAWNDCPSAKEHQAIAQYWNDKYKAVPCFISSDVIMYNVPIPVGPDVARAIALEHTAYAPDIVTQGCEHVSTLAKTLEQSTFWYFWWDFWWD